MAKVKKDKIKKEIKTASLILVDDKNFGLVENKTTIFKDGTERDTKGSVQYYPKIEQALNALVEARIKHGTKHGEEVKIDDLFKRLGKIRKEVKKISLKLTA